jgi:hypothetical protein
MSALTVTTGAVSVAAWLVLRGFDVTEARDRWFLRAVVISFGLVSMALQFAAHP